MYQFDFVKYDEENDKVVSVLAPSYIDAIMKINNIKAPIDITEYELENVYELGTFQAHNN